MAVLVLNDSVGGLVEAATYCKANDEKRPSLVGLPDFTTTVLCPEDPSESQPMATDASPDTFYVRIMFDELLDPTIEDLIPILDDDGLETGSFTGTIANTKPVTLRCTGVDGQLHDMNYDGYYSPSGNAVTWPVGPSLVIKQIGDVIVPTNADCEVTLKDFVKDKQGIPVPADQRGPFKFKVSGLKPLVIDPADMSKVDVTAIYGDNFYLQMNAEVGTIGASGLGPTSFCTPASPTNPFAGCASDVDFAITPEPGFCATSGAPCVETARHCDTTDPTDVCEPAGLYAYSLFPFGLSRAEFGFGPFGYPETEKTYTFEIKQGAMLTDRCGAITTFGAPSVDALTKVTVTTNKMGLKTAGAFTINQNDVVPATRKMKVNFTAPLDLTQTDPATITMAPLTQTCTAPPNPVCTDLPVASAITTSTENDVFIRGHYRPSTDYTFTIKGGATFKDNYGATFTQMGDKVIAFKTQAVAVASSTPANGATVTKATPTSVTTIGFTFNTPMDPTTFTADDIDFIGTPTTLTFSQGTTGTTACTSTTSTGCQLRVQGTFTPGSYTIRLKAGAVIKDIFGTDYVQAADRTINFTIAEATPAPVIPCLGS